MDLKLYREQLDQILEDLDKEIKSQFGKVDHSKINVTQITSILDGIDAQIINRAKIAEGMYGDKDTRKNIKELIDYINKGVKTRLDGFAENVSNDDKKDEIGGLYNKHVKNNATNKTQRQLDELESGSKKYERKGVDERLADAKKEFAEAKKIFEKSEKYEKLKTSSGLTDADLQNQFGEFQTQAQVWKDMLQKLEEVKKYDYQKNLEELASLANSEITVEQELVDKYKDFQKHLHFLRDKTIATALDGQDPAEMDIEDIRTNLATLQASDIEKLPEIKDNADCVEATNEAFSRRINELDILNLFPEDKKKIKESLGDDSKPLAEKWKDIEKFVKENRNVIKDLANTSKDKSKADMLEARSKISILQDEQSIEEDLKNPPVAPEVADTTKLDLTELGLDENVTVEKAVGGDKYDFAKVEEEEDIIDVVDGLYEKLYSNPEAVEATKEYLRNNMLVPANIKKGTRIGNWFRKLFRRPSKEDSQMEGYIKSELKRRVDQAKDIRYESDLEMQDYNDQMTEFDKLVQLKGENLEKFNQSAAEVIVKNKGKAKPKDVMKEAEDKMYSDDLDR